MLGFKKSNLVFKGFSKNDDFLVSGKDATTVFISGPNSSVSSCPLLFIYVALPLKRIYKFLVRCKPQSQKLKSNSNKHLTII